MQLENYFDFLRLDDIRLQETRIGIEHILYEYIYYQKSPEEIAPEFRTVTLEQVYATILYYLHNRENVGKYVEEWVNYCEKAEAEYDRNLSPVAVRMRRLKAEREAAKLAK